MTCEAFPRNPFLVRGRVVPRGWRLPTAVVAGLLVLLVAVLLAPLPWELREAVLYRQQTGEGLEFLDPALRLTGAFGVLVVAHLISWRAHGGFPRWVRAERPHLVAPRLVVAARIAVWLAFLAVLVAAHAVEAIDLGPGECFRTCAPYPR